jgi:RNA polymerase sigma-70 factor (ECF subfamily)
MDDATLIDQILHKNKRALASFYHGYAPKLKLYIGRKVNASQDIDEILQDTLFSFLESLRDYQGKSSIKTFLYAICNHKIIDFYRRKKITSLVFSKVPHLEHLVSPLLGPEQEMDAVIVKEKIHKVFTRLVPTYRKILVLKYLEDVSVGDIAHKLSISFKSAESRLFRARKAFVDLFLSI